MDTKTFFESSMVSHRLDGSNFRTWKFQINNILRSQDLLGIVDGSIEKPEETAEAKIKNAWSQRDGKAMAILFASVNGEQSSHLLDCKSAKNIMDVLESIHSKKSDVRIMMLYEEYFGLKMSDDDSVASYYSKVRLIASELEDQGEELSDNLKMCRIVSSLTSKFQHFRTVWYNIKECRTMETLLAKLQLEEDQIRKIERDTGQLDESKASQAAFSLSTNKSNKKKKAPLAERKAKSKCHGCGQVGHWKSDNVCKAKENGGSNSKNNNNNGKKENVMFMISSKILSADYNDVWLCDSAATRHGTFRRDWFSTFKPNNQLNNAGVRAANDDVMQVDGVGDIRIEVFVDGEWRTSTLKDVQYVPRLKVNLFSVMEAGKKGFDTTFTEKGCTIKNRSDNCVVGNGYTDSNDLVRLAFRIAKTQRACLTTYNGNSLENSLQQWHRRLGHVNVATIKSMCTNDVVSGIKMTNTENFFCEECQLGKMHRVSHSRREDYVMEKGECIHIDLCGPMEQTGIGGARYFMLLKDEATGFRFVYILAQKSEVHQLLTNFVAQIKNVWNVQFKRIRCDNGSEFINKNVLNLVAENGIILDRISPYTPEQNGFIERDNRTVQESARTMLISSGLHKSLWPEAVRTAVYLLNRTTNKRNPMKTPFEMWFDKKPCLDHLKVFGTIGYTHLPKGIARKKWDAKAFKVHLVGYEPTNKNFRVYDPVSKKVFVCCDVNFNENFVRSEYVVLASGSDENGDEPISSNSEYLDGSKIDDHFVVQTPNNLIPDGSQVNAPRKETLRTKPKQVIPYDASKGYVAMFVEPLTYEEAVESDQGTEWKRAIDDELQSLNENQTWEIVDKPHDCLNVVGSKWVFKLKTPPGEKPKYKARVVAKGFSQSDGIDYKETFAPVVRYDSVRVILAMAAYHDMEIAQFDVKTAFLNGILDETIYMKIPDGIQHNDGQVCRLKRSLYGLKQSSRVWNSRFVDFAKDCNLKQSLSDPCVFHGDICGEKVILLLYVDDGLLLSCSQKAIDTLIEKLKNTFKITLGQADYYVGIEIKRNREKKTITICQEAYINKIVRKFNMDESKMIATPADIGTFLTSVSDSEYDIKFPFRSACGSLEFAATVSRPDISYSVGEVCRFMQNPSQLHVNAVKRIFRYLNHTKNMSITYGSNEVNLIGYTDADHARDPETSRSVTGYAFMLANGIVTWKSKQQSSVTLSTSESEYVALCAGTKEAIWLRDLLDDIGFKQQNGIKMLCDNLGTVRWVKNPQQHHKTKHINKQLHFVRERNRIGEICVEHVNSEDQLADVLTKPLSAIKFNSNISRLGLKIY